MTFAQAIILFITGLAGGMLCGVLGAWLYHRGTVKAPPIKMPRFRQEHLSIDSDDEDEYEKNRPRRKVRA